VHQSSCHLSTGECLRYLAKGPKKELLSRHADLAFHQVSHRHKPSLLLTSATTRSSVRLFGNIYSHPINALPFVNMTPSSRLTSTT
jgi:hypothetical protein